MPYDSELLSRVESPVWWKWDRWFAANSDATCSICGEKPLVGEIIAAADEHLHFVTHERCWTSERENVDED